MLRLEGGSVVGEPWVGLGFLLLMVCSSLLDVKDYAWRGYVL